MYAAIDIGSNTLRMLLGERREGGLLPFHYYREITRLAGNFSPQTGLDTAAMQRTLVTLTSFRKNIDALGITQVRAVGTAALRKAKNRQLFIDTVFAATDLQIEVITGEEEAELTTLGVLSVIEPLPEAVIVIDIGGGSTELICVVNGQLRLQTSYPLGVVNLCEEYSSDQQRQQQIDAVFIQFGESLMEHGLGGKKYQLVGTAGTITTLAAIHLRLEKYNSSLINNHSISVSWLKELQAELESISVQEREARVGMEKGRGDLILPGLQILLSLMRQFQFPHVRVSDSGLLEGVMLRLTGS